MKNEDKGFARGIAPTNRQGNPLWLPERNGCPNEMVARTKWLPERNGCPNEMVVLTLWLPSLPLS
ncbi:MAG: hypothetical protein B6247_12270 [Candidatus Parabeggiatoa sp. nov. 2]|nr:MAG: hypothetical protein B6247_12270 [Beggiatoa sp. 4572_84]